MSDSEEEYEDCKIEDVLSVNILDKSHLETIPPPPPQSDLMAPSVFRFEETETPPPNNTNESHSESEIPPPPPQSDLILPAPRSNIQYPCPKPRLRQLETPPQPNIGNESLTNLPPPPPQNDLLPPPKPTRNSLSDPQPRFTRQGFTDQKNQIPPPPPTSASPPKPKIRQRLKSRSSSLDTTDEETDENVDRYEDILNPQPSLVYSPQPRDKQILFVPQLSVSFTEISDEEVFDNLESDSDEVSEFGIIALEPEPLPPGFSVFINDESSLTPSNTSQPDITFRRDPQNQVQHQEVRLSLQDIPYSEGSSQNFVEEPIYENISLQVLSQNLSLDEEIEETLSRDTSFRSSVNEVVMVQPSDQLTNEGQQNPLSNETQDVEQLSQVNAFYISPVNTNFSQKFLIQNDKGETLWSAKQGFESFMSICDSSQKEVIRLERKRACNSFLFPCLLERMKVSSPPFTSIGKIQQEWNFFIPTFRIYSTNQRLALKLEGSFLKLFGCDNKSEFKIINSDGKIIGHIRKQEKESGSDNPDVLIQPNNNLDSKQKILLVAAWFLMNSIYFKS